MDNSLAQQSRPVETIEYVHQEVDLLRKAQRTAELTQPGMVDHLLAVQG